MRLYGTGIVALAVVCLAFSLGAAPAAPSWHPVQRSIDEIRQAWEKPGAPAQANAPGWNAFFDTLQAEFRRYSSATDANEQLAALNRIYQMSSALAGVSWAPAARVREELRTWLRPRVRLAWAERHLVESVRGLGPGGDPAAQANRQRWLRFVDAELGAALRQYDAAGTVAQRQDALKRVYGALNALQERNQRSPWVPSVTLQKALNDLFNLPNLDLAADEPSVSPALERDVVEPGPVYFKGYWSFVTPGPRSGFGLLPYDDGVAFYNRQWMSSVTPITDFQNQLEQDRQGKRAAKLYYFNATNSDHAEIIITAILRPDTGLEVCPDYNHNIDAAITSSPEAGGHVGRSVAGALGLDQEKITKKVYEGAISKIRESTVQSARELGQIKAQQAAEEQNQKIRPYLPGNHTVAIRNLLITGLDLRSRPNAILMNGTLRWKGAQNQVGADAPQPAAFAIPEPGVSADVHLPSIMTSLTRGYLQSDAAQKIHNLMIVTKKVPPNAPPSEGIVTTQNADYKTFLEAVKTAREANDPSVMALRVKRPGVAPEFSADARGYLVALVHDFLIEVPAPPEAARGGLAGPPAQVYRVTSPEAEFVISFKVEPQTEKEPIRLAGRIEGVDFGLGAKVYALNEDENQPVQLNALTSTIVLGVFRNRLQGRPIDIPLSNLKLQGFAIKSVSPLDPSGWIRANLVRTSTSPAAGVR